MVSVVGVRFKPNGKIYYFNPGEHEIKLRDHVIVETARGIEYGQVVIGIREVNEDAIFSPLKDVLRVSSPEDDLRHADNLERAIDAMPLFIQAVEKRNLDMNLVDCEYTFDGSKVLFYFTAEGRVDFRELVKDLASIFRTRIELRQIGVRDEAKLVGGLGCCGNVCCCKRYMSEFSPVSIKMAKDQNLSLNPTKISGTCGRLMCCLKFEQDGYEDILNRMPEVGAFVKTPDGEGVVVGRRTIEEKVIVKIKDKSEDVISENIYKISDVQPLGRFDKSYVNNGEQAEYDERELRALERD